RDAQAVLLKQAAGHATLIPDAVRGADGDRYVPSAVSREDGERHSGRTAAGQGGEALRSAVGPYRATHSQGDIADHAARAVTHCDREDVPFAQRELASGVFDAERFRRPGR